MASGDIITKIADKETLDKTYANTNAILATVGNEAKPAGVKRYGLKINHDDSNPSTRCTYLYDAEGMTPVGMNFTTGTFDYGDWADIFFMKNNYPAMVKYDCTEDYKLSISDHRYKTDGTTASDVANTSYGGNAMSVFDGSVDGKIWLSQYEIGNYEYIVVSNTQYDASFNDKAYVRMDGSHATKLYYPMFGGSNDGTRLRSLADQTLSCNTTSAKEISLAQANGDGWSICSWSKRNLINCLLKLIGKNDNTQAVFGRGQDSGYDSTDTTNSNYGKLPSGTLTDKGQFFGYNDGTHDVKVFYIEKWWGDRWDRMLGLVNVNGRIKVKMEPPYNLTGEGYIDTGLTPSGTSGGYITATKSDYYGRIPYKTGGSSSTYLCDGLWFNNYGTMVALAGGNCSDGLLAGADCLNLHIAASDSYWSVGGSPYSEQPTGA